MEEQMNKTQFKERHGVSHEAVVLAFKQASNLYDRLAELHSDFEGYGGFLVRRGFSDGGADLESIQEYLTKASDLSAEMAGSYEVWKDEVGKEER